MLSVEERYDRSLNARVIIDVQNRGMFLKSTARVAHKIDVQKLLTLRRLGATTYLVPSWETVGFIGFIVRPHALFSVGDVVFQCPWHGREVAIQSRRPRACFVGYSTKKRATIASIGLGYMQYDASVIDNRMYSARMVEEMINEGLLEVDVGGAVRVVLQPLEQSHELADRPLSDADVRSYAIEALQAAQAALR